MEGFNKIFCGQDAKNTGICDCFLDPKLIVGAILVPRDKVFTAEELADANIQETLEGLIEETKKNRILPIQGFVAITDSSEEPVNQTFGYGTIEPVRDGNYNWIFGFRKGGINLSNALRSYNGQTSKYSVIFIENQNTLLGTVRRDVNGDDGLAGIPLEVLYTFPWKANDGANLASYRTQFNFLPVYINENIAFKKVSVSSYVLQELVGLQDVTLSLLDGSGLTLTLGADTDCGATNMYDLYEDELENEEAWVGYDEDGAVITPTSVTKDPDLKGWEIVWPTAPASISLAAPTVLSVAPVNISGYESNELTISGS